jgi:hypothetical protein
VVAAVDVAGAADAEGAVERHVVGQAAPDVGEPPCDDEADAAEVEVHPSAAGAEPGADPYVNGVAQHA